MMMQTEKWPQQFKSFSEQETEDVAASISRYFSAGDVIALHGDLGAGKTCFVRGLVKGLGSDDLVNSPTFTLVNHYDATIPVYHFDVYRLSDAMEIEDLDLDEYLYNQGITVIEWAEKASALLPPDHWSITIAIEHEDERTIKIEKKTAIG